MLIIENQLIIHALNNMIKGFIVLHRFMNKYCQPYHQNVDNLKLSQEEDQVVNIKRKIQL